MDIKEHMEKYPHCPIPHSSFTTFMDEGVMHFRACHYRKALYCFNRALELKPTHTGALVSRSQCYLKLGDAESALKDAETSFLNQENDKSITGLFQYGESLFNLGRFEQALIAYHRGYRCRKDVTGFKSGIHKATGAIETAIEDMQATQIEDLDIIIPLVEEVNREKKEQHCCILTSVNEEKKATKIKKNALSFTRERWVDREVLGVLQKDKEYLKQFLRRPDIKGDAQSSSEGLRDKAHEALNYLGIRQNFWRQQNPMYSRKKGLTFNNEMVRQYEEQEQEKMKAWRKIKSDAAQGAIVKNIGQIKHALDIGRALDAQIECDRALRQVRGVNQRLLPRKGEFVTEILHYKGLALLKLKNYDAAVPVFQEEYQVAQDSKMHDTRSRALDYLGRTFAMKGQYGESAEIWESRASTSKMPVEKAYLFHEIGRCYYELNKLDLARMYANQSHDEAMKVKDLIWKMNSRILLAQCAVKQKKFEEALGLFEVAEELAVSCRNKSNVLVLKECQHCIKIHLEKQRRMSMKLEAKNFEDDDEDDLQDVQETG